MEGRSLFGGLALLVCFLVPPQPQEKRFRYANRPDALYPFARVRVYKDIYARRVEFLGAGRQEHAPRVESVKIGFIGPLLEADLPSLPAGRRPVVSSRVRTLFGHHLLEGALLAVEEANAAGGYRGKPFALIPRTDLVQWGQTSNELVRFAYRDGVWAILSGIDSNHAHVLSRAALKAEIAIVNAGSTDPTLTETSLPWLVRCMNDDRLNSYELLNYIYRVRGLSRVALLRVNDRDGRVGVEEFLKGARRLGHPVEIELRFEIAETDFLQRLKTIRSLGAEALLLWADPPEGAHIVRQMRHLGMRLPVFGFDRLSHPRFLRLAGSAAEGVVAVSSYNPESREDAWLRFRRKYLSRFGEEPDTYGTHGYDGMRLILWAVRKAGLNRVRIRDVLCNLRTFPGATGTIVFDPTMNDISRPWLAKVEKGRFHFFRPPDWKRKARLPVVIPNVWPH